ncbi:MAG TPA: FtsQ-type POTRA domain-containing protein [Myxococcota bacterium]|nr:FtsQ-type POTRA domain-containing protein [Myxococcota bacterium]
MATSPWSARGLPRSAGDARDPTLPPVRRTARTATAPRLRAAGAAAPAAARESRGAGFGLMRWLGRLTLLASLAGGLYALGYGGWRFMTSSPRFDVQEVVVETMGGTLRGPSSLRHADADELVRRAAVLGKNVFTLDLEAVRRDVEADPWVRRAEVERELPARVVVRVREERPAVLVSMGALYLGDDEGRLFKRLGPGDPADFPVLSGVGREEYEARPLEAAARLRDGLAAVCAFAASPVAERARLDEVVLDPALGVTLHVTTVPREGGGAGAPRTATIAVRIGTRAHAARLARLGRVLDALSARGARPAIILLDDELQPDRVTVRALDRPIEDS